MPLWKSRAPPKSSSASAMTARNVLYDRGLFRSYRLPRPVISVGNLTTGGTGKTPVVRWLVRVLRRRGWTPGILHGGYAEDEPALHRAWFPDLPVVADRDRLRGAGRAMEMGADVLVLDDAFQHRRIGRDLDIVLVAAEAWGRTARLLPRGPYREPPSALRRADLVVVTRRTATAARAAQVEWDVGRISGRPTARLHLDARRWIRPDGSLVTSMSEDALRAVPMSLREAAYGLGATKWQTISRVILPAAFSGVSASVILGFGRAIGETMIVLMAAGNAANITTNIFMSVRTMTATIAAEMGEVSQGSDHYYSLFFIGIVLFTITFFLNLIAEVIINKMRKKNVF